MLVLLGLDLAAVAAERWLVRGACLATGGVCLRENGLRCPKELRRFHKERELLNPPNPRRAYASLVPNNFVICSTVLSTTGKFCSGDLTRSVNTAYSSF